MQLDIGPSHKQTPESSDWQSHILYFVLNTGVPQDCMLTPLLFTLYTHDCISRNQKNSTVVCTEVCTRRHRHLSYYKQWQEIPGNQQSCRVVHREHCSLSGKPRSWLLILEKKKEAHTHISGDKVEQVNNFGFLWMTLTENLSYSSLYLGKQKEKKKRQITAMVPGPGQGALYNRWALHHWCPTTEHHTYQWIVMPVQSPKGIWGQHPSQPQPKYSLLYRQTTE